MRRCYTCPAPLGKWDTSGQCEKCRAAVWAERSNPTRVPASREVIEAEVRDMLARKMAEGALEAAVTDAVTRAAYHEAAHCVAALGLGLAVHEVSIDVDADRLGEGRTSITGWSNQAAQLAEVALAGAIGEHRFLGDVGDGCGHDEAAVWSAIEAGHSVSAGSVRSILELNAMAVEKVADALLEHGHLSGGDVDALLSGTPTFRPGTAVATRSAPPVTEVRSVGGEVSGVSAGVAVTWVGGEYPHRGRWCETSNVRGTRTMDVPFEMVATR